jgi:hypothetical protein
MRCLLLLVCSGLILVCSSSAASGQNKRLVHIEVSAGDRAAVQTQQKWMEVLANIGADRVRSRTTGSLGRVEIKESETSLGILVKVFGVIDGNKLNLPGKTFQIRDQQGLRDYVQALRDDGARVALAEKKAFGLTSEQLVALNEALSIPLDIKTKNRPAKEVVDFARENLRFEIVLDTASRQALRRNEMFEDELNGLSLGTSLAAAVRPLGLVLVPVRKQGDETTLNLVDSRNADEHWPIGWPAQAIPKRMVPQLFEKYPLEIRDFPLKQVLAAVQSKAGIPMLFDYNSLARAGIELAETNITFVNQNSSYGYGLRKMLGQTDPRMAYEIRVDEAGKPFLWLSTANPAK